LFGDAPMVGDDRADVDRYFNGLLTNERDFPVPN
jgi:hypothetical protein